VQETETVDSSLANGFWNPAYLIDEMLEPRTTIHGISNLFFYLNVVVCLEGILSRHAHAHSQTGTDLTTLDTDESFQTKQLSKALTSN